MKVLIVDDEQVIGDALASRLRSDHIEVLTRTNGRDALKAFEIWAPDVVVLDIVMPGEFDGLEVCRRIRDVSDVPVMMMSAQAITENDIVEGLTAGADEYLVKPVRLNEFAARVQAMLRRAAPTTADYDDGYLSIDPQRRHVRVQGKRVHLTPTEFKLLIVLLENSGRVVHQRDLLEQVWGHEYVDDKYYPRVYISQLRRKVEPDASRPIYILTEHRIGYRFEKQTPK
ncbi:MAG: response regulator transcription factor [Anaerolineae bacterium]|nr:response regulator transcription factor [Anaerolineae bacterium]